MVLPDGSKRARLVLVGEAPGAREMEQGRPFVGPSGSRLAEWWHDVGLQRSDFYILNVLDYQPSNIERVPRVEMEAAFEVLHERLAKLEDPWLIVPTGNYALYALTGKGKVSWHMRDGRHERPGILAHRGSILEYIDRRGRSIKCIPTIHPAATFRTPGYEHICARYDWPRVAHDAKFRELRLPQREHYIKPSFGDVVEYVESSLNAEYLSIDIETPFETYYRTTSKESKKCLNCGHMRARHTQLAVSFSCEVKKCECPGFAPKITTRKIADGATPYVGCVGFATSPSFSMTIPTTTLYWRDEAVLTEVWAQIRRLCESPTTKVLQNGMFDAYHLAWVGIRLEQWTMDTRAMHHCLDPLLPHDLAFLGSIHTRQPYWKDEAKDPEEVSRYANNSEALWTYNGIDCCVTAEAFAGPRAEGCEVPLRDRLSAEGREEFYLHHYSALFGPLLGMSLHGIAVDEVRRGVLQRELLSDCADIGQRIESLAHIPIVAKKGISTRNLCYYLYGAKGVPEGARQKLVGAFPEAKPLNLPLQYAKRGKREAKTVTANEVAVRRLALRFPDKLRDTAPLILEHRRKSKMAQQLQSRVDDDGRMRCAFGFITDTGRLSSQENPRKSGANIQNQDRELREVYVADEDAA